MIFIFQVCLKAWQVREKGVVEKEGKVDKTHGCVFIKRFIVGALIQDQFTLSDQWELYDQGKRAVTEP